MGAPAGIQTSRRNVTGYLPIENYGLIGNMRTCALVGIDGSVDFMCWYVVYFPQAPVRPLRLHDSSLPTTAC
jgi:hypothetical protein